MANKIGLCVGPKIVFSGMRLLDSMVLNKFLLVILSGLTLWNLIEWTHCSCIYFHCSYLDNYYNYSQTLCIEMLKVSAFVPKFNKTLICNTHLQIMVLCFFFVKIRPKFPFLGGFCYYYFNLMFCFLTSFCFLLDRKESWLSRKEAARREREREKRRKICSKCPSCKKSCKLHKFWVFLMAETIGQVFCIFFVSVRRPLCRQQK